MFEGKKHHDTVYYFDEMMGTYHYAVNHPMKPLRVAMTDEIVRKYGMDTKMECIVFFMMILGQCVRRIHEYSRR